MQINPTLEPLGLFGCLIVGNRAIAIQALAQVIHRPMADHPRGFGEEFDLNLINGETVTLTGEDAEIFKKQISMIGQQIRFGQGVNLVKK